MDVITKDVRALAKKELAAANRRFRMFASPHEGYAVIREELDELVDEVRKLHFDANHFMQVLKNIEYALKGELTHGKIKTSVVQMIEGSLNAEPTIAPESLQPLTYNENRDYIDCDEFICHKCGIHVEDWKQIKIDPDDGEKELCEYTFKHCPECGAKVTSHKSCEFCRWHLQDGTCFNKHHSQPVTGREASCWNWEERE